MRRCLKGLGGFPTSTDGFILGPSHGLVGRLDFYSYEARALLPANSYHEFTESKYCHTSLLNWFP
jgi:hypothetical protein